MCFKKIFGKKDNMEKESKVIAPQDIDRIVSSELRGHLSNIRQVFTPDTEYNTLSKETMESILKKTKKDRYGYTDYKKLVFDCDDFAVLLKAKIIEYAWQSGDRKPLAFGQVWGKIKVQGEWANHAVNWFINNNENILFVEPQTDEIYQPKDNKIQNIYYLRM